MTGPDAPTAEVMDTDVVIAGGGPIGLMLAIELRLAGIQPVVLEPEPQISTIPKGNGLVGQIVPMLDFRGLLEPLRAVATYAGPAPGFGFGPVQLDFGGLADSPLTILAIPQRTLEQVLSDRLTALGGAVRRGHQLVSFRQDEDGATVLAAGPDADYQLRARYLAGCDGAHSQVRKQAGIGFPGVTSNEISRLGRVRVPASMIVPGTRALDVPGAGRLEPMQTVRTASGRYSIGPLAALDPAAPDDAYIISTWEDGPVAEAGPDGAGDGPDAAADGPLTLAELRASVRRVIGADLPMTDPIVLSRLVGNSRQADRYVAGRVVLAGDAAHLFGVGGSLNGGLLDAMNLGWKLAAAARGQAPPGLLASYHAERHAAGQRMLLQSRAQRALSAGGDDAVAAALRDLVTELVAMPEVSRRLGQMIQGGDVRFEMPGSGGHPLAGLPAPNLTVTSSAGPATVAELMRPARPLLLDFTPGGRVLAAAAGETDHVPGLRVELVTGTSPADSLLIRPDGYVAWASGPGASDPAAGLAPALRAWFGPAA